MIRPVKDLKFKTLVLYVLYLRDKNNEVPSFNTYFAYKLSKIKVVSYIKKA